VPLSHSAKMPLQRIHHSARQHRRAILLAFATPYHKLSAIEIDVFDPQLQTLFKAQASAVQQHPDDPHHAVQMREHCGHLITAKDDGKTQRLLCPDHMLNLTDLHVKDVLIQEQQRRERPVLGRCAHVSLGRQPRQKRRNIRRP